MKFVVSACLAGKPCRYDGKHNLTPGLLEFLKEHEYILVCPEVEGGLPIPRVPSERKADKVISAEGKDVSREFEKGSLSALKSTLKFKADAAILKSKSPSCGHGEIYDGSFTHKLIEGDGSFAELLIAEEIPVFNEHNFREALKLK